ncbi:MAG: hypothetical protein ACE37M_10505 [Henriciella sp.]
MRYALRQNEVAGQTVDVLATPQTQLSSRSVNDRSAKWPLWPTALGVTIICTAFWASVFAIVF